MQRKKVLKNRLPLNQVKEPIFFDNTSLVASFNFMKSILKNIIITWILCKSYYYALLFCLLADCIYYFKVEARTGTEYGASQNPRYGANPPLTLTLSNNRQYSAELSGWKSSNLPVVCILSKGSFSPSLFDCVSRNDIKEVYLEARGNDGWFVTSVDTFTAGYDGIYTKLTSDG